MNHRIRLVSETVTEYHCMRHRTGDDTKKSRNSEGNLPSVQRPFGSNETLFDTYTDPAWQRLCTSEIASNSGDGETWGLVKYCVYRFCEFIRARSGPTRAPKRWRRGGDPPVRRRADSHPRHGLFLNRVTQRAQCINGGWKRARLLSPRPYGSYVTRTPPKSIRSAPFLAPFVHPRNRRRRAPRKWRGRVDKWGGQLGVSSKPSPNARSAETALFGHVSLRSTLSCICSFWPRFSPAPLSLSSPPSLSACVCNVFNNEFNCATISLTWSVHVNASEFTNLVVVKQPFQEPRVADTSCQSHVS